MKLILDTERVDVLEWILRGWVSWMPSSDLPGSG